MTGQATGTAARRFEFVGDMSFKFWEVAVRDNEVTVRFGRIGSDGQRQVKAFADADTAARHAYQVIEAKIAKGYREVS